MGINFSCTDHIGIITINRPDALNALNRSVLVELDSLIDRINEDVKCIIITGAGKKSFIAGADIQEMMDITPPESREFCMLGNRVFRKIESFQAPVIAAINGYALGGGFELALSCDIRIAAENAWMGFPETGLGIIPGFGGSRKLMRIVGIGKTKELLFTGQKIDATAAYQIGAVNIVTPEGKALEAAMTVAGKIIKNSCNAVMSAKQLINSFYMEDEERNIINEAEEFCSNFKCEDRKLYMSAFQTRTRSRGDKE